MSLADCHEGFRERYLDYAALTRQLEAWAEGWPELVRLTSLGRTPEGREIWLLTVGREPERVRPAVWVDGNMHAAEVSGSSVALAIAETVLRLHLDETPPALPEPLPEPLAEAVDDALFHICPRVSPDGAERVLREGGFVRSVPRPAHPERAEPHWRFEDIDGDGIIRYMRVEDPAGDFVAASDHPGLMLPRRLQDPPPYYRIYREGTIVHWDGASVPAPELLAGTTDLNRNFPADWRPEPRQAGAGAYAGSEPETRALLEWTRHHPELYAWLNLHTFGGVFIRPLGDRPDSRMDRGDRALYRQLEAWGEAFVGYPTVSAYEEFTYQPETPLHGDLLDYVYGTRGCLAIVCELWDLFAHLDLPQPRPFVERYSALSRDDLRTLADWDAEHNQGRIFQRWQPVDHPQLGPVEVGGPEPLVGLWNPPFEQLAELCDRLSRYWLQVAATLPRLVVERLEAEPLGEGVTRVRAVVANHGYLPSWGLDSARDLTWNTPVRAELATSDCALAEGESAHRVAGPLGGWGRGLGRGGEAPMFMGSPGSGHRATLTWLVRGAGRATLTVGSARLGWQSAGVDIPDTSR